MADTASLYSFAETLVNDDSALAWLQDLEGQAGRSSSSELRLLPPEKVFCTLVLAWYSWNPDSQFLDLLSRLGFPATFGPADAAGESKGGLFRSKVAKKRLAMQVPRQALLSPSVVERHADPTTLAEFKARERRHSFHSGRIKTVVDTESPELVGIRERVAPNKVIDSLLRCIDLTAAKAVFTDRTLVRAPSWAAETKKNKPTAHSAITDVKWATITILTPPPGDDGAESEEEARQAEAEYMAWLKVQKQETSEDRFKLLFKPTAEAEAKLDAILDHLDRRGCIWTVAAHRCRPSLRNRDLKNRPEFVVMGVFPASFLDRCKTYARKSLTPLPSDGTEQAKSRGAPFLTSPRDLDAMKDDEREAAVARAESDALEGCSVRVTLEPYAKPQGRDTWAAAQSAMGGGNVG